jgi:peptidoglycan/xylan/chitin deacetylase (PgdA/CDA1 family)
LAGDNHFPGEARVALSLSFDDARESQLDVALPALEAHGVRATFYVLPAHVWRRRREWQAVVDGGHEIANHTATHPCSGNFEFSRTNALEDYSLERMEAEIDRASYRIETLLGVRTETFAYPCGQSFVGRGEGRTSFVPLVARRFVAGRGYGSETSNDPGRCDLAHLDAFTIDGLDAAQLVDMVDAGTAAGRWVVMASHDVGEGGEQTVLVDALQALCRRASQGDVWVAPVVEVAKHLRPRQHRPHPLPPPTRRGQMGSAPEAGRS